MIPPKLLAGLSRGCRPPRSLERGREAPNLTFSIVSEPWTDASSVLAKLLQRTNEGPCFRQFGVTWGGVKLALFLIKDAFF